jgi:hypothetical protein
MKWRIGWGNFQREYPWGQGDLPKRLIQSVIATRST